MPKQKKKSKMTIDISKVALLNTSEYSILPPIDETYKDWRELLTFCESSKNDHTTYPIEHSEGVSFSLGVMDEESQKQLKQCESLHQWYSAFRYEPALRVLFRPKDTDKRPFLFKVTYDDDLHELASIRATEVMKNFFQLLLRSEDTFSEMTICRVRLAKLPMEEILSRVESLQLIHVSLTNGECAPLQSLPEKVRQLAVYNCCFDDGGEAMFKGILYSKNITTFKLDQCSIDPETVSLMELSHHTLATLHLDHRDLLASNSWAWDLCRGSQIRELKIICRRRSLRDATKDAWDLFSERIGSHPTLITLHMIELGKSSPHCVRAVSTALCMIKQYPESSLEHFRYIANEQDSKCREEETRHERLLRETKAEIDGILNQKRVCRALLHLEKSQAPRAIVSHMICSSDDKTTVPDFTFSLLTQGSNIINSH